MKTIIISAVCFAIVGCADFAGNGVSASMRYTDPATGVVIDISTVK